MDLFNNAELIDESTKLSPSEAEEQFRLLIQSEQSVSSKSQSKIANEVGLKIRKYQRILSGQQPLSAALLNDLTTALGIDKPRAIFAIDRYKDWHRYYDPTLKVAVDLLPLVVDAFNADDMCSIEPMHPRALEQLAKWIAETIITHQEKICARREELDLMKVA